ncbi:MAG: hypothetical protein LLF94_10930 [Chlamydiales bacterium]|nr:hypothetical protein [Chlamydiales bacterium]
MKKTNKKDLGMTLEEAIKRPDFLKCYQFLGKFYTEKTFDTAPAVQLGQCPICGDFTWEEMDDKDWGQCSSCNFAG